MRMVKLSRKKNGKHINGKIVPFGQLGELIPTHQLYLLSVSPRIKKKGGGGF